MVSQPWRQILAERSTAKLAIGALVSITAVISALVVLVNVATRLVKALTRLLRAVRIMMTAFGAIRKK